jgi:hypothetical protein
MNHLYEAGSLTLTCIGCGSVIQGRLRKVDKYLDGCVVWVLVVKYDLMNR